MSHADRHSLPALPYPTIDTSGALRSGYDLGSASKCRSCVHKNCVAVLKTGEERSSVEHTICPEGYSVVRLMTCDGPIAFVGGVVRSMNHEMKERAVRRARRISWGRLLRIQQALASPVPRLVTTAVSLTKPVQPQIAVGDAAASLHDIKTATSLVNRNLEALIKDHFGGTAVDDIQDPAAKRLGKSVELLNARLALVSLLANPASAKNGQRTKTPVYRVFDRFVRLFEPVALDLRRPLEMCGNSSARFLLHRSVETIPLVLLDNALKYGFPGRPIRVSVMDGPSGCRAEVESYGYTVPADQRGRIFDRGFRGSNATSQEGSGLGLFLAKIVARANGLVLEYRANVEDSTSGAGWSTFSVEFSESVAAQR